MDIKSPVAEARNEYLYSAGGIKLRVTQKWNLNYSTSPVIGSGITTTSLTQTKVTDYVGNKVYENGGLKRILIDGGYIENNAYHFYLTDHLGDNRVVTNATGVVVQKNHYYPFGMAFAETSTAEQGKQPYKYNNKELDLMHGVNMYDYSARYMDGIRFTSVDPLAEINFSVSPYAYCDNNPIKYIDVGGLTKYLAITMGNEAKYRGNNMAKIDPSVEHHVLKGGINNFISILSNATKSDPEGVGFISLFAHGNWRSIFDGDDEIRTSDLQKLGTAIDNGDVKFTRGAIIYLGVCNVASDKWGTSFAQELADVTGSIVVAADDRVGPKDETNGNMRYTVAYPRKNQFFKFGYSKAKGIGAEVDVFDLLKEAKFRTNPMPNIEQTDTKETWNDFYNYMTRVLIENPNVKINIK